MKHQYRNFLLQLTVNVICILLAEQPLYAQADSTKKTIGVTGNVQFTNNGIAPVPAFSLGRPAMLSTITINKGRFYFNPEFNFGLNLKPWTINLSLGYNLVKTPKWTVGAAARLSLFFKELEDLPNQPDVETQRYVVTDLHAEYRIRQNRRLVFMWWYSHRLNDYGVISGHFFMLNMNFDKLRIGHGFLLNFSPSTFYITNKIPFYGYYFSQVTSLTREKWWLNVFIQTVHPIYSNPNVKFNWNTGINLVF